MSHVLSKPREIPNQPAFRQLELDFPDDLVSMPLISDQWDFKEGELWYDALNTHPEY